MLKTGILYADWVNTVSPTYAKEIQTSEFGGGLEGVLQYVKGKISGILNGIDYEIYDPEKDKQISYHFNSLDLTGKAKMKAELQKRVFLPINPDIPVIGMVSRLTNQKGFDLVLSQLEKVLEENVQIVLLGTGFPEIEEGFRYFSQKYPDKLSANIAFDIQFAQEIYAGSDFFLMPSAFEPCGLSQMIAMRYGTLPIVHEIGGLKDTVIPFNPISKEGTGFGFVDFEGQINYLLGHPNIASQMGEQGREYVLKNFSWNVIVERYINFFRHCVGEES